VTDSTETALFRKQAAAMNEALLISAVRQQEAAEVSDALNARLQAAISEKEYFIAVLPHELRTPLTPVLMAATLLMEDKRLEADTRAIIDLIHRNITLEARLIDDLLDMTRMERGKLHLDRHPVELREVVEHAVETCRADLEARKLVLDLDTPPGSQIVDVDAGRMQQVFSNLIRNAIKFIPPGGRVGVGLRSDAGGCTVEISDSGEGMESEFIPLAFKAFEQGDKGRARKAGLGLGLAIL
jgi:two-component system CheB/CheR fusion protein